LQNSSSKNLKISICGVFDLQRSGDGEVEVRLMGIVYSWWKSGHTSIHKSRAEWASGRQLDTEMLEPRVDPVVRPNLAP
jgi:hypothetical protein